MTIRTVSTLALSIQSRRLIADNQREVSRLGQEMSTGLKADVWRDLGMTSANSLSLRNAISQAEEYKISCELVGNKMEVMAEALTGVRKATEDILNLAVQNISLRSASAGEMQGIAQARIADVVQALNTNFNGEFVFSGVASADQTMTGPMDKAPATGRTPLDTVRSIIASIPGSTADVASVTSELDAMFDSTHPDPSKRFEGAVYGGSPLSDPLGNPMSRVEARPDTTTVVRYGVQGNDRPVRDILEGMFMLAAIDASQIADDPAYKSYVKTATDRMMRGVQGLSDIEAKLGTDQMMVAQVKQQHEDRLTILNNRVTTLEGADPYETQAKLTMMETQMEATYSVTARLARMSFTKYF